MTPHHSRSLPLVGCALLLAATWMVYSPGLAGGFLFDDFVNLPALNSPGPVDNWPAFWRYVTSGTADPTGRPLAMLSFLLDAREWPADPAPFLRTNLALHLVNGALLFVLLRMLTSRLSGPGARTDATALLSAGLWLLHPLFVSTTLYIVQREAMLPATFTLLGLLAFVAGRTRYEAGLRRTGLLYMVLGIACGTALAVLSKANGILLPMLAWTLDATVLRGPATHADPALRRVRLGLLVLPSVLVLAYLASWLPKAGADLAHRPWTVAERLLTEPRVLLDYLQLLAIPRAVSTGLYNDSYTVSTSPWQPASTLPALVILLVLVALAFRLRRRAPILAGALLFFFAGHVMESTTIPLELYFEHRNYLPAMLLFWPLGHWLCAARARPPWLPAVGAVALLALLSTITLQRAHIWGQPDLMARLWAARNAGSPRAQATAASFESRGGRPEAALQRLAPLWRQRPYDLQIALNYANAACATGGLAPAEVAGIAEALRHADAGHSLVFRWLERARQVAARRECPGIGPATLDAWLAAAMANPMMQGDGPGQDMSFLAGRLELLRKRPDRALEYFNRGLRARVNPEAAAMQAALLATDGHYAQALAHLDLYDSLEAQAPVEHGWGMPRLHQYVLERQGYWPFELGLLRRKLVRELEGTTGTQAGGAGANPAGRAP